MLHFVSLKCRNLNLSERSVDPAHRGRKNRADKRRLLKVPFCRGVVHIKVYDFEKPGKMTNSGSSSLKLELSELQRKILLKACKIYRAKIPSYLSSKQTEVQVVDELIEKLT